MWLVLSLAGFHTYLISTNQTTNEDIKGSFSSKRGQDSPNPYSRGGICSNCWHTLCGPVVPSLIDRRGIITSYTINDIAAENRQPISAIRNRIAMIPLENTMPPLAPQDLNGQDSMLSIRPSNGSYTNLYIMDESEHSLSSNKYSLNHTDMMSENGIPIMVPLYSNVTDNNSYMNQNLDLDPVVLTVSKDNSHFNTDTSPSRDTSKETQARRGIHFSRFLTREAETPVKWTQRGARRNLI
jgi:palmitoyltransferase ZDHHC9/14/18